MLILDFYQLVAPDAIEVVAAPPWWGTPVISGAFLLSGALIGLGSNWLLDRYRSKRDSPRRWDDNIREYAAEFLGYIDAYIDGLRDIQRPVPSPDDPERPPESVTVQHNYMRMQAIIDEKGIEQSLWRTMNKLDFIAPDSVAVAGRALQTEVSWARTMVLINDPTTSEKIERLRLEFVSHVRSSIELTPLELARPQARARRRNRSQR